MGGLVMPPMMAVAGFLMAEFMGVPYWDVVMRGFAISFVYFTALSLAIYLMSVRLLSAAPIVAPPVALYEAVKTAIFFLAVSFLIVMMGWVQLGALHAALYTAMFMFVLLLVAFVFFKAARHARPHDRALHRHRLHQPHGRDAAGPGPVAHRGADLPTATYIILAVITVDPMRKLGIDPWVAHFFAFLMAIFGELSPPTSLTAAVAARIAKASFMATMWEALKLCLPLTFLTFAIFIRSDMVTTKGWPQVADTAAWAGALVLMPATILAVIRHKRIAPPNDAPNENRAPEGARLG